MTILKRGLGRGLDALIPPPKTPLTSGRTIMNLPPEAIHPNPHQPRKVFDEAKLQELSQSIKEHGVVQPIVVRRVGDKYELVAGERRWRASRLAGMETIPVIVREATPQHSMEIALIENLQRENLSPIEEANAYQELLSAYHHTQEELAKKLGKSRSAIANSMRLLKLPSDMQESIQTGAITAGHARTLLGIEDPHEQILLWRKMVDGDMNVREAESMTAQSKNNAPRKASAKHRMTPDLSVAENKFSKLLATKVNLRGTASKGVIMVHYYSQEDLERILEILEKQ